MPIHFPQIFYCCFTRITMFTEFQNYVSITLPSFVALHRLVTKLYRQRLFIEELHCLLQCLLCVQSIYQVLVVPVSYMYMPSIPSSQGWAPNICLSYATCSLLKVVYICDGLSPPVNSFILIILIQSFILQHILNYNYGLLSLITYDGLCRLWYNITLAFVTYGAISLWLSITYCPLICMPLLGSS